MKWVPDSITWVLHTSHWLRITPHKLTPECWKWFVESTFLFERHCRGGWRRSFFGRHLGTLLLFIGLAIGNLCVRVLAIGIEKRHLFGQCKVYHTKGGAARLNSPSLAYPKNFIVLLFRNTLKSEWYLESSHHKYFLKFYVKKSLVIGKYDLTHAVCQEHVLQTPQLLLWDLWRPPHFLHSR